MSNPARLQRGWPRVVLVLCCAAVSVGVVRAQSGGYVFTAMCPIPPGVPGTACEAWGINNSGEMVGLWNGEGSPGFLYNDGTLSPLTFAGGGINNSGQIVGGSVLDVAGSLSSIDFPGALLTVANGINDTGEIVGFYEDSSGNYHGFLDVAGSFSSIDFPGASSTMAYGINNTGQVVGSYYLLSDTNPSNQGFLYSAGSFSSINYPGAAGTWAYGINNSGQISGTWEEVLEGESSYYGFVDSGGTFISLEFPGAVAASTNATSINDAGEVVGWAILQTGKPEFGFLAVLPTAVSVSPTTISFSGQLVGTTSPAQRVTVTNTGTAFLVFSSISVVGDFAAGAGTCNVPVPLAGSCSIPVTFTPTAAGARTGTLTVMDNATPQTQTVAVSGTGFAPVVSLSGSVDFPSQPVSTTSAPEAVTLTNTGTAALTIDSIAISGDFSQSNTCGASVAPSANCTINVTFTPAVIGTRSGALTISDNAASSPQIWPLTGTGTGVVVSLAPASLTFSAQISGISSAAQSITLTNSGNATLTVSSITANGDFSQTNTCGTKVSAGASCTISVTFKPTAGGNRTGSISIADNAPNSPQIVELSGTGQDFTLASPSGSPASATISPGQPATYTLGLLGQGGFNQSVTFACSGAPAEATCTVSPSPVTPGSSATNITVSVATTGPSLSAPRSRPLPPAPPLSLGLRGLLMVALVLASMAWAIMCRTQPCGGQWRSTLVLLASGLLLTLALAGCGGGGGAGGPTPNPGTPAGTYTLTVTGTTGSGSSALSHSATLTLNVN